MPRKEDILHKIILEKLMEQEGIPFNKYLLIITISNLINGHPCLPRIVQSMSSTVSYSVQLPYCDLVEGSLNIEDQIKHLPVNYPSIMQVHECRDKLPHIWPCPILGEVRVLLRLDECLKFSTRCILQYQTVQGCSLQTEKTVKFSFFRNPVYNYNTVKPH